VRIDITKLFVGHPFDGFAVARTCHVESRPPNAGKCSRPPSGAKCEYLIVIARVAWPSHVCTRRMGAPPPVRKDARVAVPEVVPAEGRSPGRFWARRNPVRPDRSR
jgi:hypothetical protein